MMDINSATGTKVMYVTSESDEMKVNWGGNDDPADYLVPGTVYTVDSTEVHSFHTKVTLKEFPDRQFNSTHFESV